MPYPAPPGPRLAYDLDGTVVLISQYDGSLSMLDVKPAAVHAMNSDRYSGMVTYRNVSKMNYGDGVWLNAAASQAFVAFLFPVPTRLMGIYPGVVMVTYTGGRTPGCADIYTSTNTTNGLDGTWTLVAQGVRSFTNTQSDVPIGNATNQFRVIDGTFNPAATQFMPPSNDSYRRLMALDGVGITALAGAATRHIKGLRIHYHHTLTPVPFNQGQWSLSEAASLATHIYGTADDTSTDDRIAMWRPDLDVETPGDWFSWGDTPLSSSADKSFRIKNLSNVHTANNIAIRTSASFVDGQSGYTAPSTMFTYSLNNKVSWTSSVNIAALSPGTVSGIIWVRRTVPATAPLSNWSPRVLAEVETWT